MKCLQGISFSQLTVAEKAKIKNLGRATPDLGISQSSASGVRTYVRKYNPSIYTKRDWLSGRAERSAVLGLVVNSPSPISTIKNALRRHRINYTSF